MKDWWEKEDFSQMSVEKKKQCMESISFTLCDRLRDDKATYEDLVKALERVDPKISEDQILSFYGRAMFETR